MLIRDPPDGRLVELRLRHWTGSGKTEPWPCGQAAASALADHIDGKTLDCRGDEQDRYGRTLAVCWLGLEDVNGWLVSEGWALAYRRYSMAYVAQKDAARLSKRGIWKSEFVAPWEWRQAH